MHIRDSFCCLKLENIFANITEVYTIICLFAADKNSEVLLKNGTSKCFSFNFKVLLFTVLGKV